MCVYLHINEMLSFGFSKGYFIYFNISQWALSLYEPVCTQGWTGFLPLLLSTAWGPHSLPGWPKATFSQQGRGSRGTCSSPQVNGENFETTQSLKSWNNTKILPAGSHLKLILIFNCEDISVACVFISSLSTVLSITKLIFTSPVLHSSPFFSNWRVLLKLCLLKHSTIVCDVL